jgi:rSAM/selenodomain-associated transferase 1
MNNSAIIIMAKEPREGYTKTRLTPPLSALNATRLYEALLRDTITLVSEINEIDLAIAVTPPESIDYFKHISPSGTLLLPVECNDIGDCLMKAMRELFKRGYSRVFALNADSPTLPPTYIEDAIQRLELDDIVLGPTADGGYYLIGVKQLHDELFINIGWSTASVLSETMAKADKLGQKAGILAPWYDVDTIEDIMRMQKDLMNLSKDLLIHTRSVLESEEFDKFKLK